jgi:HK97 family phage prohead protease
MYTQDFTLKLKALDDAGTFTGYGSTYGGDPDLAGDVIEAGAFTQSIKQQGNGYPLLWAHRTDEPIGIAKVSDDPKGLKVDGTLVLGDPAAQRAYTHLKAGSIKGLSIGYSLPYGEGKITYGDDGTRTLKEIHLHELSLVAIPANPKAQVTAVKSLVDVEHVLRTLRDAKDADVVMHLRAIDAQLKRLLIVAEEDEGDDEPEEDPEELEAVKALAAAVKGLIAA